MSFLLLVATATFAASQSDLVYSGRIIKPDGTPVTSASVLFNIAIYAPNSCLLYSEAQTLDLSQSLGTFSLKLGGSGTAYGNYNGAPSTFNRIFSNAGAFTGLTGTGCSSTYSPSANDDRTMMIQFNDGSGPQTLAAQSIKAVPFASSTAALQGVPLNINALTLTNGQILSYDSTTGEWKNSGAAMGVTNVGAGNGLLGGPITGDGTLSVNAGTGPLQIVQLDASSRLPAVDGSQLTNLNTSQLSGTLAVNHGGTGLAALGTANQILGVNAGGSSMEYKTVQAGTGVTITHTAGTLTIDATGTGGTVTNVGLALPAEFTVTGSPVTLAGTMAGAWASQTQNYVLAAPKAASGTPSFRKLEIIDLFSNAGGSFLTGSSCTAGQALIYASATDTMYCADVTSAVSNAATLNNGKIWIGDATNKAQEYVVSGDASMTNLGTLTVNKLQGNTLALATPSNGQVPTWNNALSQWEPQSPAPLGITSVVSGTGIVTNPAGGIVSVGTVSVDTTYLNANYFKQGGNSFGVAGTIGTADNFDLVVRTNNVARMTVTSGGSVGIGVAAPAALLDIAGEIKFGNTSLACAVGTAGAFRYNAGNMEFCNGAAWTPLAAGGSGEVNTASNQGVGGVGLYDAKSTYDLQFRNINAATGAPVTVTLDAPNKEVDLDIAATAGQLLIGNASNLARSTAMSGDATITALGTVTVAKIQNRAVASTAPADGQLLAWNNALSQWEPANAAATGVTSVMAGTGVVSNPAGGVIGVGTLSIDSTYMNANYFKQGGNSFGVAGTIGTADNFDLVVRTNNVARMTVTAGGSIGIGVGAPAALLDIAGEIKFGNTSLACAAGTAGAFRYNSGTMEFCNGAAWTPLAAGGSGEVNTGANIGTAGVGVYDSKLIYALQFKNINAATGSAISVTDDVPNHEIDLDIAATAGQLLIGNASNLARSTAMSGDATITALGTVTVAKIQNRAVASTAPSNGQLLSWNNALSQWEPANAAATGVTSVMAGTGLTSNPAGGVVSVGSLAIDSTYMNANYFKQGGNSFGVAGTIGTADNFDLVVRTNNVARMTITSGGSVGIGVAAPAAKLDIAGEIRFGNTSLACAVGTAGAFRYNAGTMEFCNGAAWTPLAAGGSGEVNTGSNQGVAGVGVFDAKAAFDLQFRNINAAAGSPMTVTLDAGNKEIDLDIAATAGQLLIGNASNVARSTAMSGDATITALGTVTVSKIQNRAVASTAPSNGQLLSWNNALSQWEPANAAATGVTNVGMTVPSYMAVSPASVTSTGTFAVSYNAQAANKIFAGPASGADAAPDFRLMALLDLPWSVAPGNNQLMLTNGTGTAVSPLALTSGQMIVGSASGVPSAVSMSGDATITALGTVTVAKIQNRAVSSTAPVNGQLLTWNNALSQWEPQTAGASGGVVTSVGVTNPILNTGTASAPVIDLAKDATQFDLNGSNQLHLKAGGITDTEISGTAAIARTKLANGTADHVLINDGAGVMSSEAQLAVSRGGTGQSTFTNGQLLIGNTTTGSLAKGTLIAGTGITITNGTGSISISADTSAVQTHTLTTGKIWVGSGNVATEVTVSGDATLSSLGTLTLGTVAVAKGGTGSTSFTGSHLVASNAGGTALVSTSCPQNQVISFDGTGAITCVEVNSLPLAADWDVNGATAGGTIKITGVADPTVADGVATKNYVDTNAVKKTGDIMSGSLGVSGSQIYSVQQTVTGATINFATGNTQVNTAPGAAALTLNGMQDGGSYTLVITDTTSRTYTFAGCTAAKYMPANMATSGQTVYSILKVTIAGTATCYISWITGF